ncbi:restriction endonuclease subunit S [Marinomonas sp. TI.3.20]|uniref:restriction endonuclease subunit S n=1 Tax=Marinomonas sp. TI.3.20 TaxID=3121296 RepID=UPI00311D77D8
MPLNPSPKQLITDNLDIWTAAIEQKSTAGRGSSKKYSLHGIKKLRELILELAVRGKLVPQDPNDEPAFILLDRIATEKAQLIKDKKIKKQKPLPEIREDEKPFELPNGWEWCRLGESTDYGVCDKAESSDVTSETWVLELEDVEKATSKLLKKIRYKDREFKSSKNRFNEGDVIYGKLRPYLDKVLIADEAGVCTTEMIPIKSYGDLIAEYLRLIMKSPYFIVYANESTHGMNLPRMGTDKARMALLALAPLQEQHRIVAKVDELMSLCDALEAQTESSISAHQTLVTTLLDALLLPTGDSSSTGGDFQDNWQRISEHFDTLFTTTASIDALKQTILQLAVMGKLVPQDPNDELASKLLERIAAEKAQLIKDKKIKKQKPLLEITEDEKPFELPEGWEWVRFGILFKSFSNGLYKPAKFYTDAGVISLRMYNIQNGCIDFNAAKRVEVVSKELEQFTLEAGDLLINRVNSKELVGKTAIIPKTEEPLVYESMNMRAKPFKRFLSSEYLNLFMMTGIAQESISAFAKEAIGQASINQGQVNSIKTPLPPLEEQHRIVSKIDELMALCDSLKARLTDAQTTQQHLADALVKEAL